MVFNEEIVVIDSPPSPCPHQPKPTKQSTQQLPPSAVATDENKGHRIKRLSSSCGSSPSSASESSTAPTTSPAEALPTTSQQQLLIRRRFVDVVKRLCSQLANRMSAKTGQPSSQNKIKDLKQVAPLQVPKEENDVTEPVQLGDLVLLRKTSANGKVRRILLLLIIVCLP